MDELRVSVILLSSVCQLACLLSNSIYSSNHTRALYRAFAAFNLGEEIPFERLSHCHVMFFSSAGLPRV